VAGREAEVERVAGTSERPIVRLACAGDRDAAGALGGEDLLVSAGDAPALGPEEWWAHELEGCRVLDGERRIGVVRALRALPSCEALEVERAEGGDLLVPLVRDAVREIDVDGRRIEVDLGFLEGG
jgi:16S rRNA processing protein RimM